MIGNKIKYIHLNSYAKFKDVIYLIRYFMPQFCKNFTVHKTGIIYTAHNLFNSVQIICSEKTQTLDNISIKLEPDQFILLDKNLFAAFKNMDSNIEITIQLFHKNNTNTYLNVASSEGLSLVQSLNYVAAELITWDSLAYIQIITTFKF